MSGHQVSHPNTYNRLNHPQKVSFPPRAPGWSHCPSVTRANSLKHPCTPSGSDFSSCSSPEASSSPSLPVRRMCVGRLYNSKCVETSHLVNCPKVAKSLLAMAAPTGGLLCTDCPSSPSSPTFLDQLIKGINYLDRSTSAFYTNCPKSQSLPKLAASYLERAANSIHLDHPDHAFPRSYSNPSTSMATSDNSYPSTCIVPSTRGTNDVQCVAGSANMSCPHQLQSQSLTPCCHRGWAF